MTVTDLAPGFDVEASFKLSAALDKNTDTMRRFADTWIEQAAVLTPFQSRITAADSSASSGNLTLDLGGPTQGWIWELRNLVVGGVLPTTAVNGSIDVYVSGAGKSQQPASTLDWIDHASTVPRWGFYGAGDVYIRYPENLYVVITSPTASTVYMAAGTVLVRPDSPTARASTSV